MFNNNNRKEYYLYTTLKRSVTSMSNVIFTSSATAKNGREGHVKSADGLIDLNLVNPANNKEDKGSNPEQLFAAAYSACYDGALNLVASKKEKPIDSETTAEVSFCKDQEDGGNKTAVSLYIKITRSEERRVGKECRIWRRE